MGVMKWMMKRGALGGIARSTARNYTSAKARLPNASVEELYEVCIRLRYGNRPDQIAMHIEVMMDGVSAGGFGLLNLCHNFARWEMNINGIEYDVEEVLRETLIDEGVSSAEIKPPLFG